ncbi:HNH endonuclease [Parabacteroides sp.]|uniref:HNH endonuclease n=1 Tax=Parabacteroides sp. TaxID=1869337 RepID=UPI00257CE48D|nr:HNH endonuclease [Parabacteroides sp.]
MARFSEQIIDAVWQSSKTEEGYNPDIWRKDFTSAWIRRDLYGMSHEFGWEIDHLKPISKGGTDELSNLQALHWQNNRRKGDDYPKFYTALASQENKNIEKVQSWKVEE